jgi:hypothetical protein
MLNENFREKVKSMPWLSSWELVNYIYGDISLFLKFSAQANVRNHLIKLENDGKVIFKSPDLWKIRSV